MDLLTLILTMIRDGYFMRIAQNAAAQFGVPSRQYLGATLLPERSVMENAYRETSIRYRTVVGNDGTRYSPVQKKGGALIGDFLVELGESDIGAELTGRDYDALIRLLGTNASMEAMTQVISWADVTLVRALVELLEKQRWEAIVNAAVVRRGDNGYTETVNYSNPAGHRANAGGQWSDNAYDPFDDIFAMGDLLASKGYTVSRIVTGRQVLAKLAKNAKVRARVGVAVVSATGQIQGAAGRASLAAINDALQADGLPPIELYDLQYRTQSGSGYFLPRDAFVMACATGRDETVDLADAEPLIIPDTLGYTAIGRAVGQADPGRVIRTEVHTTKPPRVEGEAWQTALPVITEPESLAVIKSIS